MAPSDDASTTTRPPSGVFSVTVACLEYPTAAHATSAPLAPRYGCGVTNRARACFDSLKERV
jgi:hypothetical protein